MLDVGPAALDEMRGQPAPMAFVHGAGEIVGEGGEVPVQEREERAERFFLAAVGRGGDQDEVPAGILGEPPHV